MLRNFLSLLLFVPLSTSAFNSPDSPSWPSEQAWTEELGSSLSSDAALHGPFVDNYYQDNCEDLGSDAYAISRSGNGICMHAHACQYEFCSDAYAQDLPAYTVEVKTPSDIQQALEFGRTHNIPVTVKATGHSYHGASTARNSLLIWMQKYPKDDTITENYESCNGETTYHAIISINGGETWDDVIEAVGDKYHVVTGGGRTVGAAGGWLMGSGLSFSSRKYGLGVDNVLEFQVVMADGSLVTANACENIDLFWALRGGGGGTWGVVTNVKYKLYPVTPITSTYWMIEGWENAPGKSAYTVLSIWLEFLIELSKDLDPRFGGFWRGNGIYLVFAGTREEADEAFLTRFEAWYNIKLIPKANFIPFRWGAAPPSSSTITFSSWYDFRGGSAAYNNPDNTDPTGDSYEGIYMSARLVPLSRLKEDPQGVFNLLYALAINLELGPVNYLLGGVVSGVDEGATAVSPALRKAVWNLFTNNKAGTDKVYDFLPNNITGACFNHHSPIEPNWRTALWGKHYDRLLELKSTFDPAQVFNCWHCVGYKGEENPPLSSSIPGGFCFSGENTVEVQEKGPVKMADLALGDIVQVANGNYEPIYSFGHKDSKGQTTFLQIRTSVKTLEISPDHMVITKGGSCVPASIIKKGDLLLTATKDLAEVTSITTVVRRGAFAPFTSSGTIIVNGILASNYIAYQRSEYLSIGGAKTPFTFQWIAHTFNSIHRLANMIGISGETYVEGGISRWVDLPHRIMLKTLDQNIIVSAASIGLALILVSIARLMEIIISIPVPFLIGGAISVVIYCHKKRSKL